MDLYGRNDFTGFQFGDKHSVKDFEVYRVSEGSRYTENYLPSMQEKTVDVPGQNGSIYFGTEYQNKTFSINLAFDHLTEPHLREFKSWLNGMDIQELVFDEEPYKVWYAKVTGSPSLKYICFSEKDYDGKSIRIYKGEGTVQFTTYVPYAQTPRKLWQYDSTVSGGVAYKEGDGRIDYHYSENFYPSRTEWFKTARLPSDNKFIGGFIDNSTDRTVYNYGDLPAWFEVTYNYQINSGSKVHVAGNEITINETVSNLTWNSKTGLVSRTIGSGSSAVTRPIQYTGKSYCTIPVKRPPENGTDLNPPIFKIIDTDISSNWIVPPSTWKISYNFLYI